MNDVIKNRTITRWAFSIVIVFVLIQVIWWLVFQYRYINGVSKRMLNQWETDTLVANLIYQQDPNQKDQLLHLYPHLKFDGKFLLDETFKQAFERRQLGFIRMFAFEGPFFVLVVLTGLYIIAKHLRSERELKKRQQNFLSAITHEFKTPISTLKLLIETALFRKLSKEKSREYLEQMKTELLRLEKTSEQVLASARLEASKEDPVLEPLELNSVLQGIIGKARPGLETKGAELNIYYCPEPLPVSLDPEAFSVVINNLLDNALKYSPNAVKPIDVRLEQQSNLVLTHIEDQGIGIAENEKAHIFDRFYRVGSEMTRQSKGVGLGLYLVKSIVEAMNGWIRVKANEPKGTRFTIVLPKRVFLTQDEQVLNLDNMVGSKQ